MERKRKASNPSILSFFKKEKCGKTNESEFSPNTAVSTENDCVDNFDSECEDAKNQPSTSQNAFINQKDIGLSIDKQEAIDLNIHQPYDIGLAVGKILNDSEKLKFLKETWRPDSGFEFLYQNEGKQQRKFNLEWLDQYNWLTYSAKFNGGFCKMCVLFASTGAGKGSQVLKTLVKLPLTKFKKAIEEFRHHENTHYHKFSVQKAELFSKSMKSGANKNIAIILDSTKTAVIEKNKKRLRPIVKTILFCARNNLPLRGHRDDGVLDEMKDREEGLLSGKRGVFNSLLSFRLDAGDEDLKHHLNTCGRNNTFISKTIQNEVIECIADSIRAAIVSDVKKAKFYAILCDETTDASTEEQMTFSIRYVNIDTFEINEEFLGFSELKSATGITIKKVIDQQLENLGLSYDYLCGQGYDGGSNMAGKFNGVQALILAQQPLAIYTHCFSHSLNLVVSKTCELPAVRNMMGIVSTVCVFLSASANRSNALQKVISESDNIETKKTKLKAMCPTRWVERHDTLLTFKELLLPVMTLLDEMSTSRNTDSESSAKAFMYSTAMRRGDFIVALQVTAYCLSLTCKLSETLQSPKLDISSAVSHIKDVIEVLKNVRRDAVSEFGNIFEDSLKVSQDINSEIKVPRTCAKQTSRENIPANNAEEYFRRVIFLPVVDHFISELSSRFNKDFNGILPLEGLIPSKNTIYSDSDIHQAALRYQRFFKTTELQLKSEFKIWRQKWENSVRKPETIAESLKECDRSFFPTVATLLQIFGTIPVTTSTAERSFSTLKRLKTYLRSSMGQTRLNGLALANIHKDRKVNVEEVIEIFCKKKSRRLTTDNWQSCDEHNK